MDLNDAITNFFYNKINKNRPNLLLSLSRFITEKITTYVSFSFSLLFEKYILTELIN